MKALMSSELRKLTTTMGPWLIAGGIVVVALLNVILAAVNGPNGFDQTGAKLAGPVMDANTWTASLAFFFGILVTGTDHRYGVIVPTYLANPRRGRVLAAKLAVAACAGTALAVLVFGLAVAVGFPILASQGIDLGGILADPVFWGQAAMGILSVALVTTFAAAMAAFLHSLLATIGVALAVTVVEVLSVAVPYIPLNTSWTFNFSTQNMIRSVGEASERAWWVSALVVVGWLAVYVVAASVRTFRQDAA